MGVPNPVYSHLGSLTCMDCVSASSGAISDRATYVDPTIDISIAGHERYINIFAYLFVLDSFLDIPTSDFSTPDFSIMNFELCSGLGLKYRNFRSSQL